MSPNLASGFSVLTLSRFALQLRKRKTRRKVSDERAEYLSRYQHGTGARECMIWEAVDLLGVQKESRHVPLGLVGVLLKK